VVAEQPPPCGVECGNPSHSICVAKVAKVVEVAYVIQTIGIMDMASKPDRPTTPARTASKVYAYQLPAEGIRALASSDLTKIGHVTVISTKSLPALRARRWKGFVAIGRETPISEAMQLSGATATPHETVPADAFEPDARGRTILRGLEFAHADLLEAGGAYDLEQARAVLGGVSRQAIDKRVKEGSILAVPGPSNRRAYPTFQFNSDGSVVAGLKTVQDTLPTQNPWAILSFLTNPQTLLDGARPIDELRTGAIDRVVDAARNLGEQGG
jgi:hypothetical protein